MHVRDAAGDEAGGPGKRRRILSPPTGQTDDIPGTEPGLQGRQGWCSNRTGLSSERPSPPHPSPLPHLPGLIQAPRGSGYLPNPPPRPPRLCPDKNTATTGAELGALRGQATCSSLCPTESNVTLHRPTHVPGRNEVPHNPTSPCVAPAHVPGRNK